MKRDSKRLQDAIDVMTAYRDGADIERLPHSEMEWHYNPDPGWNWTNAQYRIKPKPREFTLEATEDDDVFTAYKLNGKRTNFKHASCFDSNIKVREVLDES